ncbi:Methyltransferase FkbM family [Histomonas meleagridis]|uniref:Methyltransferase FkbM family n=1 Tax=Histomonas meleagridis TaxID=135588 RepID=UPI0035596A44|nr:Methyltransferase FkbM family [Histomonas meleagridis]KAH0797370.1 Methyltransferase FkbM family [Histomonas meleagridis]
MLEDSYKNFQIKENPQKKFYCSIVVPGRNDKYGIGFENRLQNFLNAIEYGIKTVPLADVEVIFVDYATPIENPLLSDVINVSKTFTGKVRFIVVPPNAHRTLEERYQTKYGFLEYVAKNIGVRRSQGKIILTTNADCLFPTEFFELIAGHQFNTAVIYRGNRWNLNNTMLERNNITMNEFIKIISETWRLKNMELSEWCTDFTNRFAVIDSCDEYYKKECSCAPGDFQMLSKDMWHAMQGFNELPANYATDSVFIARIMKLIPGYMRMFVHPLFFHQNHEGKAKQNRFPKEKKVKKDYCCIGNCIACGPYYDCDDWGLAEYAFDEVKY